MCHICLKGPLLHSQLHFPYPPAPSAFFRLANGINDINLIPAIKDANDTYNESFRRSDSFLSGPTMRKPIYYDDLREYSSASEVYRITGKAGSSSNFPTPSLWRQGQGIDLFWDLYEKETGCSRVSLNGQDMSLVQRKLVRSLR